MAHTHTHTHKKNVLVIYMRNINTQKSGRILELLGNLSAMHDSRLDNSWYISICSIYFFLYLTNTLFRDFPYHAINL